MNADAASRHGSQDQHADARPESCPSCGAAVRQDVPWCLQCYASLLPQPQPEPAPEPPAVAVGTPAAHRADGEAAGVPEALAPGELDAVAGRMLAELAAQGTGAPAPAWASHLPDSRGGRAAVLAGVIAAAVAVLVAAMSLVGLFL